MNKHSLLCGWALLLVMWMPTAMAQDVSAVQLLFVEQEAGIDPYQTRMLINDTAVRIDDGDDAGDYVLFDRRAGAIFNVMHDTRSVLVVRPVAGDMAVAPVVMERRSFDVTDAPAIGGITPKGYAFVASGEVCDRAIVVPGLLPKASAAVMEFRALLAIQSRNTLAATPSELRTPCFLASNILAPARHWEQGLPLREWNDTGYRRELLDFNTEQPVPAHLFAIPEGYQRDTLPGQ